MTPEIPFTGIAKLVIEQINRNDIILNEDFFEDLSSFTFETIFFIEPVSQVSWTDPALNNIYWVEKCNHRAISPLKINIQNFKNVLRSLIGCRLSIKLLVCTITVYFMKHLKLANDFFIFGIAFSKL